jgi:hypothetical protein
MSSRLILFEKLDYGLRRVESRHAGILMETVAEVASAEEETSCVIELRKFSLGSYGRQREDGMLVGRLVKNA